MERDKAKRERQRRVLKPFLIYKYKGEPCEKQITCRFLTENDFGLINKFQDEMYELIEEKEVYCKTSTAELMEFCQMGADILGLFDGHRFIAYSVAYYPGNRQENYGYELGVRGEELLQWADFGITVVHVDYRGNNLQQKLLQMFEDYKPEQIHYVGCTVSPINQYSLHNVEMLGYQVKCRKIMYGNFDRFILVKTLE